MPVINFVWIGEPRFDKGGQDVLGPESFDLNFKKFPQDNPNPMVYWCQERYLESYDAYFKSKGIVIEVQSIENYLRTCPLERDSAEFLFKEYKETILDDNRNRIIDRVYFKDMYFNYILATQGGYVLDTNIMADTQLPTILSDYPTFMFPVISATKKRPKPVAEVWMQYAPPQDLVRAKLCLEKYIELYSKSSTLSYTKAHHTAIGKIAVDAVLLNNTLALDGSISPPHNSVHVWRADFEGAHARIMALPIIKEYYNTHRPNQNKCYSPSHIHVLVLRIERLQFDLDHGISPDLVSTTTEDFQTLGYNASDESLLHTAIHAIMKYNKNGLARSAQSTECIHKAIDIVTLLLAYNADPNRISTYRYFGDNYNTITTETPLSLSIKSGFNQAIEVLFEHSKYPIVVDIILDNKSPLILAIEHKNTGLELLLKHGANPNQSWQDQTNTPLTLALFHNNNEALELLLAHGANPNQTWEGQTNTPLTLAVRENNVKAVQLLLDAVHPADINKPYINKGGNIASETPLHIALRQKNPILVKLLLERGADLAAITIERVKTLLNHQPQSIEKTVDAIATSPECEALIKEALLHNPNNEQNTV